MTTNYFNQETVQEMVILIIYSAKDLKAKPVLKKTWEDQLQLVTNRALMSMSQCRIKVDKTKRMMKKYEMKNIVIMIK